MYPAITDTALSHAGHHPKCFAGINPCNDPVRWVSSSSFSSLAVADVSLETSWSHPRPLLHQARRPLSSPRGKRELSCHHLGAALWGAVHLFALCFHRVPRAKPVSGRIPPKRALPYLPQPSKHSDLGSSSFCGCWGWRPLRVPCSSSRKPRDWGRGVKVMSPPPGAWGCCPGKTRASGVAAKPLQLWVPAMVNLEFRLPHFKEGEPKTWRSEVTQAWTWALGSWMYASTKVLSLLCLWVRDPNSSLLAKKSKIKHAHTHKMNANLFFISSVVIFTWNHQNFSTESTLRASSQAVSHW